MSVTNESKHSKQQVDYQQVASDVIRSIFEIKQENTYMLTNTGISGPILLQI